MVFVDEHSVAHPSVPHRLGSWSVPPPRLPDGKIASLEEHKIMMRGLAPSALSCVVMPGEGGDAWIVAGFRK